MDGWAAIVTAPGQEFLACQEINRFCLTCFLPQRRRRIFLKSAAEPVMYAMPLIPCRVLMPLRLARDRALHYARGVKGPKFLVVGADGRPWTVPDAAVRELSWLDREGVFDDPLPHNAAQAQGVELITAIANEALANLFAPLFPPPVPPVSREPTKAELLDAGRPSPNLRTSPWVDQSQISAATSRDVLAAIENGRDDRSFVQRSADASAAQAAARAANPIKWKYRFGPLASAHATERV